MISSSIETLNSNANPSSQPSFMKLDIAIATSKGVLKMATLKMHLKKLDMEKVGQRF